MNDIVLHPGQSEVIQDLFVDQVCRYAVVKASRGYGKSYLASAAGSIAVSELMALPYDVPNKNVAIIAPTYSQVVDIYYPLLAYEMGMEAMAEKSSRAAGTFWMPNNVKLKLWSYEASARMRGTGQYFVVGDEVTSWIGAGMNLQESWESIIQPTITTRWSRKAARKYGSAPGRALIISTPSGYDQFYDMYNMQERDKDWKSYSYDYHDSPFLDPDEIESLKQNLDPIKFAREYAATFEDSGANVFYMFNRNDNVNGDIEDFKDGETVHAAIDFNVGIMATVIFAVRGNQIQVIDEMSGHPDTEALAKALSRKYEGHPIVAYPDPSGRARKTSAATGITDFKILENHKIKCLARSKAPPIVDSVAAVNKKLKNAAGVIDMLVHPRCHATIKSLERTGWVENNPNTATISKKDGVEHWTDGIRYAVEFLFPIQQGTIRSAKGFGF